MPISTLLLVFSTSVSDSSDALSSTETSAIDMFPMDALDDIKLLCLLLYPASLSKSIFREGASLSPSATSMTVLLPFSEPSDTTVANFFFSYSLYVKESLITLLS